MRIQWGRRRELIADRARRAVRRKLRRVSVVIPARNEGGIITPVLEAIRAQPTDGCELEVIVVDDGSTDDTAVRAKLAGARVLGTGRFAQGNPGMARNAGAANATGELLVFLDADCVPRPGWLRALLSAHRRGATIVGGALAMPKDLPPTARCDYYCSCYHLHPRRSAGEVRHHSPANLSVRSDLFRRTQGFITREPVANGHEELGWQLAARQLGHRIVFEPRAIAEHHNDPGLHAMLRRAYRWGYSALQSKSENGLARLGSLYRVPALVLIVALPGSMAQTVYIVACWARAGWLEPLAMLPAILLSQIVYGLGMIVGGLRWLREGGHRPAIRGVSCR